MVLVGSGRYVFVYNISTGVKGPELDSGGRSFDSLYITTNYVTITWNARGTSRYQGVELFDRNMIFQRQLTRAGGHMDITIDVNGDEVLLWTNSNDPTPIANCQNGIVKVRLDDARQTCLLQLPWSLAVHISAPDRAGWVMVETYAPSDPMPSNWSQYTNEIVQITLDGTETRRLAHHRSRPLNSYQWQPKVAVNRDGSKAVFGSNYSMQTIIGYPSGYNDTYMINVAAAVPGSTGTILGGTSTNPNPGPTTVTRTEETASTVAYTGAAWFNDVSSTHSGSSARFSVEPGARSTFSFNGTGASWITYRNEWTGIARIYLDGVLRGEFDTFASPGAAQYKAYTITGLANGAHTLAIEVTGRSSIYSNGGWVWIDAFEAISETTTVMRIEETASTVAYTGATWFNDVSSTHSGSSARFSVEPGARSTFSFNGTGASWITYRNEWTGIARVYVDGVLRGEFDTFVSPGAAQYKAYTITGLANGAHTLAIEVTGRSSIYSNGGWVWIDAFEAISGGTTTP